MVVVVVVVVVPLIVPLIFSPLPPPSPQTLAFVVVILLLLFLSRFVFLAFRVSVAQCMKLLVILSSSTWSAEAMRSVSVSVAASSTSLRSSEISWPMMILYTSPLNLVSGRVAPSLPAMVPSIRQARTRTCQDWLLARLDISAKTRAVSGSPVGSLRSRRWHNDSRTTRHRSRCSMSESMTPSAMRDRRPLTSSLRFATSPTLIAVASQ
mmetsp:Transcript_20589/g.27953  ORF Transcript_20589/g.27953 Transcript_20589/m.27953 type:complete len:209 (+) Transcript_20589:629-1255(+)